ncbi:hypothetical protein [Pseudooceanicola onchidii]|uniref:hypothetical protein n=1 Tax=Pseudooceanicola onchidii TaxID=2562279 RepID=UPI0010AB21D7|nr:hypothetical protein [Pseudooceanicola onchidii]
MGDTRVRISGTGIGRQTALAVFCGTTLLASGSVLLAQQSNTANEIRFGISTSLRHETNERLATPAPGSTTRLSTDLSFGLTRQTTTSLLDFSTSGAVFFEDTPAGTTTDAELSGLRLYFEKEAARSKLTLQARVSESDLSNLSTLVDPITGDLLTVEDPGRRRSFSLGAALEAGRDGPLETRLALTRSGARYYNTLSPSYADSDTLTVEASARMRLSPVLSLTPSLSYTDYEAQDAVSTRRETRTARLGMSYELDQVTSLNASLGYSSIDQSGAATLRNRDGATFALGVTRQVTTGQVGLSYDRTLDNNGTRDRLTLSGSMELPRGKLSGSIGYAKSAQSDGGLVASIDYSHALPDGQITLAASRAVSASDAGFDQITTQLSAAWSHQINGSSSFGVNASYSAVDTSAPGGTDTSRTTLGVSYDYQLTQDWTLSSGLQHRVAERQGQPDASSNAIFVTIGRDFSYRY